jgi:acetyltransferase-like isoleucine patch superfamily enzyme
MGKDSSIHMNTFITGNNISIGKDTTIGRYSYLDGRSVLHIGDHVSISPHVHIITASHEIDSSSFANLWKAVTIEDYAWIGSRATILPGVKIGKGAVVATGAVVTKDVQPFTVVAGIPARKIKDRSKNLDYKCQWFYPFD